MGETTIAWCDFTMNFWIGCSEASDAGCATCYARELDKKYQFGVEPAQATKNRKAGVAPHWGAGAPRHRTSAANWRKPFRWNDLSRPEKPTKVFTSSLSDLFDNEVDPSWRADAWEVIRQTTNLRWIVLTKRVPNIKKMLPDDWSDGYPNVGLVASVVDNAEMIRDSKRLLAIPAKWHGFSLEPQVERIVLPGHLVGHRGSIWIITGGDSAQRSSGLEPRPYDVEWARTLIRAGELEPKVHVFVKQLGAQPIGAPAQSDKQAGAKPADWPPDIRVRNYPPELLS